MHDNGLPLWRRAVIALGSNQGDSVVILQRALMSLASLSGAKPVSVSSFYTSAPAYYDEQDFFVNAVCIMEIEQTPLDFLYEIQEIENQFHRVRSFKNAPRTLDLDLIDIGGVVSDDPILILPHPLACERDFVVTPLWEIDSLFVFANGVELSSCRPSVGAVGAIVKSREELVFS